MQLMPLRRVVIEVTHEAFPDDVESTRKAIRSWHNRLQNHSIPRTLVKKLGRELFLDLNAWQEWLADSDTQMSSNKKIGRPRTK